MPANPIVSSGPISMNLLNDSFGRATAASLSFSQAFGGTYAQYGAINRNTTAGQNIYTTNLGGTDFALTTFYSYNDVELNYWYYTFDNQNFGDSVQIDVYLATTSIYSNTVPANTLDDSGAYVSTGTSATTGGDLELQLTFPGSTPSAVDISVTDPDTGGTIFSVTGDNPNNYVGKTTLLAAVYGYQRMNFYMSFTP